MFSPRAFYAPWTFVIHRYSLIPCNTHTHTHTHTLSLSLFFFFSVCQANATGNVTGGSLGTSQRGGYFGFWKSVDANDTVTPTANHIWVVSAGDCHAVWMLVHSIPISCSPPRCHMRTSINNFLNGSFMSRSICLLERC